MSKLKIEHGASKINLVLLKTNIEDGISSDIDLMCRVVGQRTQVHRQRVVALCTGSERGLSEVQGRTRSRPGSPPSQHKASTGRRQGLSDVPAKSDPASANHV